MGGPGNEKRDLAGSAGTRGQLISREKFSFAVAGRPPAQTRQAARIALCLSNAFSRRLHRKASIPSTLLAIIQARRT